MVLKDWFAGEGFQSGVVLAVKDHNPYIVWKNKLHPGGVSIYQSSCDRSNGISQNTKLNFKCLYV